MVKLVNTSDSKSDDLGLVGSSPTSGTTNFKVDNEFSTKSITTWSWLLC